MVGLMFFEDCFRERVIVSRVESLFGTLDFGREGEIDFDRDDVDLPDEIFGFE